MDLENIIFDLHNAMISQEHKIMKMANGTERLDNIRPSPVFVALELRMPSAIIQKLIDNGADIRDKMYSSFGEYDEYPLTIALVKGLSLDYIKILCNTGIPPVHIIGMLKYLKSSDQIVEYLLNQMSEFLETDEWMKEWKISKYEATFWEKGRLKQHFYMMESYWAPSTIVQAENRVVRSTASCYLVSVDEPIEIKVTIL